MRPAIKQEGARAEQIPRTVPWVRDDRLARLFGAAVWVLVVIMIVPDGFDYSHLSTAASPASGGALSRMLWLGLLGFGGLVLIWRAALAWLLLRWVNPFLLAFAALAVLSVGWSIEPTVTVRRLIRIFAVLSISAAFVLAGWHTRRFQGVVRPILTIMLLGSIVFGLVNPSVAIHQDTAPELVGAWRGLANHKNTLGALACVGVIFWFHAWLSHEVRRLPALAGGLIATACLVLSRSSTSLVTSVMVITFLLLLMRSPPELKRWMPMIVALFAAVLVTYAVAVLRLVPGLEILLKPITLVTGKDLTFTGRSEIWELMAEHIRFSPGLGTGYGAYWIGAVPHSPSYVFVQKMHFYPGSAHNGYLEIVNDLGMLGLACLGAYLAVFVSQALQVFARDRSQGALYLGLFFQQAIANLTEAHWLNALSVNFVITTLATMALARTCLEYRLRAYFGDPRSYRGAGPGPAQAEQAMSGAHSSG